MTYFQIFVDYTVGTRILKHIEKRAKLHNKLS